MLEGIDVYIGTKIYNFVAYVCLFVPRNYQIYVAEDPEALPYDPEREKEKHAIVSSTAEEVRATQMDGQLQLKKWIYFVVCNVSNVIGVTLTLWGLGMTVVFEQFGRNDIIFYCSLIFYIPFVMWVRVLCFPGKAERERRKYIRDHRLWRKAVNETKRKRFLGIQDDSDEEFFPESKSTKAGGTNNNRSSKNMTSMKGSSVRGNSSLQLPDNRSSKAVVPLPVAAAPKAVTRSSFEDMKTAIVSEKVPPLAPARSSLRGLDNEAKSKKSKRISFSV